MVKLVTPDPDEINRRLQAINDDEPEPYQPTEYTPAEGNDLAQDAAFAAYGWAS